MRLISRRRGRVCVAFSALALASLSPLSAAAPFGTAPAQGAGLPDVAVPLDSPDGGVPIDLVGISDLHGYIETTFHKNPETGEVDLNNVENPGVTSLACHLSRAYRANPRGLFIGCR